MNSESTIQKEKIRNLINGVYDIQKLRIQTGNRIVQSFNQQMGQKPSTKLEEMGEDTNKMIEELRKEYNRVTDAYINKQYSIMGDGSKNYGGKTTIKRKEVNNDKLSAGVDKEEIKVVTISKNSSIDSVIKTMSNDKNAGLVNIKSKIDYELIGTYVDLSDTEERMLKILSKEVNKHPMWDLFFKDIKGCGTLMAAVCIAYFDIDKARHVSSFWRYAGLDTVECVKTIENEDGTKTEVVVSEGRSARHAKYNEVEYVAKDGTIKKKNSLGYNPELKTKLVGVLGSCLLKSGLRTIKDKDNTPKLDENGNKMRVATSKYAQCYLDYMNRLNNRVDSDSLTPLHKHAMANRYMIKQFVRDLWVTWREYEGYEVSEPYEVAKLGYKPHKYNEYHERVANSTKKAI